MGEGLAAAVAGDRHAHQAGIHHVLHVAGEDAVLDQHGALGRVALVVDRQRAAAIGQRAVVHHGDPLGRDLLADAPRERRATLAVEVPLEAVADRLVEQDARPAGAEHHRHGAGRGRIGAEVHARLMHRLAGVVVQAVVAEPAVVVTPAAAGTALLAAAVLFHDHGDRHAHQRTHVGRHVAVAARHHHHLPRAGDVRHDLGDAWILATGEALEALEQLDLGGVVERVERVVGPVQAGPELVRDDADAAALAGRSDRTRGGGGADQGVERDVVGVGEGGLLAADRAHAHTLLDVEAARLDDALFQAPGLGALVLEVEVGEVDVVAHQLAEGLLELRLAQAVGRQQVTVGDLEGILALAHR